MELAVSILIGYLVGSINPAYLISRMRGFDIRSRGSGNAGASNALVTMGKLTGIGCAVFDILKATAVYKLAEMIFPGAEAVGIMAGAACILGHIFPLWMGFKGGKGLASVAGTMLAYDWKLFLIVVVCEVILVVIIDYICAASVSFPVVLTVLYAVRGGAMIGIVTLSAIVVIMLIKHISNIKRIIAGEEVHFSILYKKDKKEKV
ncbi:MAG: glycerol-3-phosphate acyltransferase [Clostridia bacterium]|nr:glycerol-3-phosphate acyltransferase [Clostridia bacterium]